MDQKFTTAKPEKILFIDIETVPQYAQLSDFSEAMQQLWTKKAAQLDAEKSAEALFHRAGIYAEFGKIICISVAYMHLTGSKRQLRVTSFASHNEPQLLHDFLQLIIKHFNSKDHFLCAHNGKEFDFPYIGRRLLINGFRIPHLLDSRGLKPWDVRHFDTLELWRFGDYKHYTSLELLTQIFNIPSPKTEMNGSDVCRVYWEENGLERITEYCQADVIAVAQLWQRYRNEQPFVDSEITVVAHL